MIHSAGARWATVWKLLGAAAFSLVFVNPQALGGLLDPSDTIIAIDTDSVFGLNGRYPGAEGPANAIDGNTGSKYLNFGKEGSGFIVTPFAPIPVESFQITTANDRPGRDPGSWELYGTNDDPLVTTSSGASPAINPDGLAENWTLIGSGALMLPGDPNISGDQRGVAGPLVVVNPGVVDTGFTHYKMIFPTLKATNGPAVDSMQFAEIQFFTDEEGMPANALLQVGDPIVAVDEVRAWVGSNHPNGERPALVLDQDDCMPGSPCTKYLNFGEAGSGFIVTNSDGPIQVGLMQLETANDSDARDPASYELYGTNDTIQSVNNSEGLGGEVWTLISSGALSLPITRGDNTTLVPIDNNSAYSSYKLIFPTVRNADGANSMQIANVQFFVPEPMTLALVIFGGIAAMGVRRRSSIRF